MDDNHSHRLVDKRIKKDEIRNGKAGSVPKLAVAFEEILVTRNLRVINNKQLEGLRGLSSVYQGDFHVVN